MRVYFMKRLALIIPSIVIITVLVFVLMRMVPGDVVDSMTADFFGLNKPAGSASSLTTGTQSDQQNTFDLARKEIEKRLGLDVPIHIQYLRWLGILPGPDVNGDIKYSGIFQGNFGVSLRTGNSFVSEFAARAPVTIELNILMMIISTAITVPFGVLAALRQETFLDYAARSISILCMAIPGFWIATILIVFGGRYFNWTPSLEYVGFFTNPIANLKMMLIPALLFGVMGGLAGIRGLRTMTLEVMRQDYVRTAWSKGLKEWQIVFRHAFRNAMVPFTDGIAGTIGALIGGSVIIENIFALPGLGRYTYNMIILREYSLVSGTNLIFGTFALVMIMLTDLSYAVVDPRIRYK